MTNEQELILNLRVTVTSKGIEHELDLNVDGYSKKSTQDIQDIINEDIDYLVEDLRRRVTII